MPLAHAARPAACYRLGPWQGYLGGGGNTCCYAAVRTQRRGLAVCLYRHHFGREIDAACGQQFAGELRPTGQEEENNCSVVISNCWSEIYACFGSLNPVGPPMSSQGLGERKGLLIRTQRMIPKLSGWSLWPHRLLLNGRRCYLPGPDL